MTENENSVEKNMGQGFIALYRSVIGSKIWEMGPNTFYLAVWMLLKANWKPSEEVFNGCIVKLKRGQLVTGRQTLTKELKKLTEKQIRGASQNLKKCKFVASRPTSRFSIYTIVNYDSYQIPKKISASKGVSQGASQGATIKQDNNITTPQTPQEISAEVAVDSAPKVEESGQVVVVDNFDFEKIVKVFPKLQNVNPQKLQSEIELRNGSGHIFLAHLFEAELERCAGGKNAPREIFGTADYRLKENKSPPSSQNLKAAQKALGKAPPKMRTFEVDCDCGHNMVWLAPEKHRGIKCDECRKFILGKVIS